MKKKAICLMIAGLSLFASPFTLKAGNELTGKENSVVVVPPVNTLMEKKVNEFKKHHPDIFRKNKTADHSTAEGIKRDGGVLIISGSALLLIIIILLIVLL